MAFLIRTLWNDDSAQDMAEYGLLLALIAVVVTVAVVAFRDAIVATFEAATAVLTG
jgi:Flp pilus assembly pilin Flp